MFGAEDGPRDRRQPEGASATVASATADSAKTDSAPAPARLPSLIDLFDTPHTV